MVRRKQRAAEAAVDEPQRGGEGGGSRDAQSLSATAARPPRHRSAGATARARGSQSAAESVERRRAQNRRDAQRGGDLGVRLSAIWVTILPRNGCRS